MPRKKQTKRSDNRFEYKSTIGKDIHGKPIRKSFYSTLSLADAKQKAKEYTVALEVSARTGEAFIESKYNFSQWAEKWLTTYKKPFVDYNTYQTTYRNVVNLHIVPYFGSAELKDIRPADIQAFAAKQTHLSESYLKKIKMCLVAIFDTAIENDLCYKNPAKRIVFRSDAKKREKQVYTPEQIKTVHSEAMKDFPPAAILLDTGLRRGEFLGLVWTDITLEPGNASISVQRSVASESGRLVLNPPKKRSYRTVPISDETAAILNGLPHNGLYVFPSKVGTPCDPDHFSQRLKAFMLAMHERHPDIPVLTSHELRHTYGTNLRRQGVDIYTIQKLLGHKNIQMTSEIYVHNELDQLRTALFPQPVKKQAENI